MVEHKISIRQTQTLVENYRKLPQHIKKKFKKQLRFLQNNPKHPSLRVHRIEGSEYWEFYVDDFYRCIFKTEGSLYTLMWVGTHKIIDRFSKVRKR